MPLTLNTIPGYTDLSNTPLVAESPAFGMHVEAISSNAAFGKVRTEIFHGLYFHGDTVPTPVSPIDKYVYERSECIYFYNIAVSTNKTTGWITIGCGSLWFSNWFVDQSTGQVTSDEFYRNGGSAGGRTPTNDGQIIVYTIAHRQRTTLLMAETPTFTAISESDIATDKPWTQALSQGLNSDAKFSVNNHEVFFCGEYVDGDTIPLSTVISPDDGYAYSYAECKFLGFWRWTSASNAPALTQPPEDQAFLGPFAWNITNAGGVQLYMERISNEGDDVAYHNYGRIGVMAFCTRAGTPATAPLGDAFAEIDEGVFVPGSTLRASTVLQMKRNIDEAILTPEFFSCADLGVADFVHGNIVPLPVSPVDGYTYSRDELTYVWSWNAVRPAIFTPYVRVPLFYGGVNQTTGAVNLHVWRLKEHYVDGGYGGEAHIKMVVVARRNGHPKTTLPINSNPSSDWPKNDVVSPYGISYDMGGARTKPPATGEVLQVHLLPTLPTGMDKYRFQHPYTIPTSTIGSRTAPNADYTVTVRLNGSAIATMTIPGGATTGSVSLVADNYPLEPYTTYFGVPYDKLEFVGSNTDSGITGIHWVLMCNRY